jgi:hypothetical protein
MLKLAAITLFALPFAYALVATITARIADKRYQRIKQRFEDHQNRVAYVRNIEARWED